MVSIPINNKANTCRYCYKFHSSEEKARECENSHDVVFLPLLREDLNRLVNFIATGETALLTERLSKTLFYHFRKGLE